MLVPQGDFHLRPHLPTQLENGLALQVGSQSLSPASQELCSPGSPAPHSPLPTRGTQIRVLTSQSYKHPKPAHCPTLPPEVPPVLPRERCGSTQSEPSNTLSTSETFF